MRQINDRLIKSSNRAGPVFRPCLPVARSENGPNAGNCSCTGPDELWVTSLSCFTRQTCLPRVQHPTQRSKAAVPHRVRSAHASFILAPSCSTCECGVKSWVWGISSGAARWSMCSVVKRATFGIGKFCWTFSKR